MNVALADLAPVLEGDAELERGGGGAHELLLVDAEQAMKYADRRDRRLTDSDGADLIRLDQHDVEDSMELVRHRRGGEPAGGAAAGDHQPAYFVIYSCENEYAPRA